MTQIVLAGVFTLAAVSAPAAPAQQPAGAAKAEPAHNTFVLSGCLEPRAAPTAPFKLTRATTVGQAPPARTATTAAPDNPGARASATFDLLPVAGLTDPGIDAEALGKHVGWRVEVTVRPVAKAAAPAAPSSSSVAETALPQEPEGERFTVSSIKRVGGSCR